MRLDPKNPFWQERDRFILSKGHGALGLCQVITVTNDVLKKLHLIGRDLTEYSLDTVKMFYEDGRKAGYTLEDGKKSKVAGGTASVL
jgi:hypothetical protein